MKRFLNLALALGLLVGTANAASAASIGTWIDRLTGGAYNSYNYGYPYNSYNYNYGYGYPASYYNSYGYNPYTSYYSPYNSYNYNYGYNYNPYYTQPSVGRTLGNLLLNWF